MTFNDDADLSLSQDFAEAEANYPQAFGITFTPQVTGIALGVVGLITAAYLLLNFVKPAYDSLQTLKEEETTKQEKVDAFKSGAIDQKLLVAQNRLTQAELLRSQVLTQFTSSQDLETLLYDISRLAKGKNLILNSYTPTGEPKIVNDNSLGNAVNKKLKRQTFNVEIEGSYPKIHAFLGDLEKLQPLLLVSGLKMAFDKSSFKVNAVDLKIVNGNLISKGKIIPNQDEIIKASFLLEAILPLTPEELAKIAKAEEKTKKQQSPKDNQTTEEKK
jgi:Tfp pilus assembly protein PilO